MYEILVVEDDELIVALRQSFLQRAEFELRVLAPNGGALAEARARRPTIVLLGDRPSADDSLEVCRQLKADPDLHAVPVVMVGALPEYPRCAAAGADGFVARPVSHRRLLDELTPFLQATKRTSGRRNVSLRVSWHADRGRGVAWTRDLCPEGLFLETADALGHDDVVRLSFALPEKPATPILAEGAVVRVAGASRGVGIQFRDLSEQDRMEILRFVAQPGGGGG